MFLNRLVIEPRHPSACSCLYHLGYIYMGVHRPSILRWINQRFSFRMPFRSILFISVRLFPMHSFFVLFVLLIALQFSPSILTHSPFKKFLLLKRGVYFVRLGNVLWTCFIESTLTIQMNQTCMKCATDWQFCFFRESWTQFDRR